MLLLLSPNSRDATAVWQEVIYAVRRSAEIRRGAVLPIIVSDPDRTLSLLRDSAAYAAIEQLQFLDFSSGEFDDNFALLMRILSA